MNNQSEENEWTLKNDICKTTYSSNDKCNEEGTGCTWKLSGSYINEKNETIDYDAHCSNSDPYLN